MKAAISSWSVTELGPAPSTRQELRNSKGEISGVSFDSMNEVTLRIVVIGREDAKEFLDTIRKLTQGATLKGIEIAGPKTEGRKYVFRG